MPDPAVNFVLENVRNEYGNGNYQNNHQNQLLDLAWKAGISQEMFYSSPIKNGTKRFILEAPKYYFPSSKAKNEIQRGAMSAGAITATELLALEEFKALHVAFSRIGQADHIWFHHVTIEDDHSTESIALINFFNSSGEENINYVERGLVGILDATVLLYDGLLESMTK